MLQKFKSHKVVQAGRIASISLATQLMMRVETQTQPYTQYADVEQPLAWFHKHEPKVGGYYVVYEDGYASYSPAEAFEKGYTTVDSLIVETARLAHEVNRAYSAALGDHSHAPWEQAPDWQRNSTITGVQFHVDHDFNTSPEQSHESWLKTKVAEGWRYGPVKDPEAKTHPCFMPYAELPEAQRMKDTLFVAVVNAMLKPRE